jgi:hypothetical protein
MAERPYLRASHDMFVRELGPSTQKKALRGGLFESEYSLRKNLKT